MKKSLIKGAILVAVFLLSVFLFARATNRTNEDMTREMSPVTLPVISCLYGDKEINLLHAYTEEMDSRFMRETITPISEDRMLSLKVWNLLDPVDKITYQIRSLDGNDLYSDAEVEIQSQDGSSLTAMIEIQGIVDPGKEYTLILNLEEGGRVSHFYTRIILPVDCFVEETLNFATEFHRKALSREEYESLVTWLEPDTTGDNSTLQKVDIHSSVKQIGYGDFEAEEVGQPYVSLVEINPSYNVVLIDYVLSSAREDGLKEYYNVSEYFRVRHTEEREYLLNYERTMNQIYRGETADLFGSLVQFGIRDADVDYVVSEDKSRLAFVQEQELWYLNLKNGRLYQVYSFRGLEGIDPLENYAAHDVRIVNMEEDGSLNFLVYGYMNRGEHEGLCGIALNHFDGGTNTVEETAFLPSTRSFTVLRSDLKELLYESRDHIFYFLLGQNLYRIDLERSSITMPVSSLTDLSWAASDNSRYLAWISDGDENSGREMTILDMESKEEYVMEAEAGEFFRPLGFMQEDLIYGVARESDIYTDAAGLITFPMRRLCIMNAGGDHSLLKEYEKEGFYVADISVSGYTIYLDRLKWENGSYVPADPDTIMNREGENMEAVSINSTVTVVKETEIQLDLGEEITNTSPRLLTPKEIVTEEDHNYLLPGQEPSNNYYVYAKGQVAFSTDTFRDAVQVADEAMGVVIDTHMRYVWMRARALSKPVIPLDPEAMQTNAGSIASCIRGMLAQKEITLDVESLLASGQSPKQILQSALRDYVFLDLSGCDITETLYYISNDIPVFAMSGTKDAVLLVGYDGSSVTCYDPVQQKNVSRDLEEAKEYFGGWGNIYFTYIE